MTNDWAKHNFSGFDFKAVPFEKAITMFEHVKIAESIYKGVVE